MHLNVVPARTGLAWARQGVRTFWRQPMAMTGLFVLFVAVLSLTAVVPLIGFLLALVLMPAATLGMMAASRDAEAGRRARPAALFAAFRAGPAYARQMLLLGALYAGSFVLMLAISALFDGGQFAMGYVSGNRSASDMIENPSVQVAMWITLMLYMPLSMLFWHAPALVFWYRVSPLKSLFFSFVACIRNVGAFTVYGLAWAGIFLAGAVVVGTFTTLLLLTGVLGDSSSALAGSVAAGLVTISALVLVAMFFNSLYFTFVDCFVHPVEEAATADDASPSKSSS
ncbi:BPSS1780 family membrane protein [Xylophilus sp. GOD-11R]|uniref:BPSS1780 family membrane protein n=1 Tax=Xylophilus sp. GOD-11R TaxID=3089814 RepID=UPI00298C55F2|nr:BPSS1780 family membrane protein [Xylophilus sp. GOD-11R]WPB58115.1 BPSS1780 family membrane protein [Xylophilus sp. GOD-11R]